MDNKLLHMTKLIFSHVYFYIYGGIMRQINRQDLIRLLSEGKSMNISEQVVHVMFLMHGFETDVIVEKNKEEVKKIEENNNEKEKDENSN